MPPKPQEHYLKIQQDLLKKMVDSASRHDFKKQSRFRRMSQAVSRDAFHARTGLRPPPTARQSYSRGIMTFGVSHVRKTCHAVLERYAPPEMPLVSVGCGDARLEEDLLKASPRSFYLVDPAPSAFMGRDPFLPVRHSTIRQLPSLPPCVLCIFWPEPGTASPLSAVDQKNAYDMQALDTIAWDILITIYTHDGTSGSDPFVEKMDRLCRTPRWYTVLHDEWKQYGRIHIRFVILIRERLKTHGDIRAHMRKTEHLLALRRKYYQIDTWKATVRSKIPLMKPDDRPAFYAKMAAQIRLFCQKHSLSPEDCKQIIDFLTD